MNSIFTHDEIKELENFVEKGGILIRIPNDYKELSTILKEDGNGSFVSIGTLSEGISIKMFELYPDPIPMRFHLVGLQYFMKYFC